MQPISTFFELGFTLGEELRTLDKLDFDGSFVLLPPNKGDKTFRLQCSYCRAWDYGFLNL